MRVAPKPPIRILYSGVNGGVLDQLSLTSARSHQLDDSRRKDDLATLNPRNGTFHFLALFSFKSAKVVAVERRSNFLLYSKATIGEMARNGVRKPWGITSLAVR